MNMFFKIGEKIFKVFAVFLILLALLLESLSKTHNLIRKDTCYSNGNRIKPSIHPRLRLYGN
ncbi:MAG TPA: hypothetical protein HA255_07405 [Methanosphaera sp.]|nr:hypothetical protein [Methanosphaera sp.]